MSESCFKQSDLIKINISLLQSIAEYFTIKGQQYLQDRTLLREYFTTGWK